MICTKAAFHAAAAPVLMACLAMACHPQQKGLCPCEDKPFPKAPQLDEEACLGILELDEQVTIKGAVRKAIDILKEGNFKAIFDEIAYPQDVEDLKEEGYSMYEIVKAFAEKRADVLLMALESIVDAEPELSSDRSTATFTLSGEPAKLSPSKTLTLVRLKGRWYLKN